MRHRKFYSNAYLFLSLGLLTIAIGFFPSYFSRLGETDPAYHFHGITATLWMLILIVQPLLYRLGYLKTHRIVGRIAIGIALLVILGGLNMMRLMIQNKAQFPQESIGYQLAFIDIVTILGFILFITLALIHRKNVQLHSRYMICTIFAPLVPALFRVFFLHGLVSDFQNALTLSHLIPELVLLFLIYDDKRSGKIRPPYVICLVILSLQHILMYTAGTWEWWQSLMNGYVALF